MREEVGRKDALASKKSLLQADKLEGDQANAFDQKFIQDELDVIQKRKEVTIFKLL